MKKLIAILFITMFGMTANPAAAAAAGKPDPTKRCVSIFSTSTDWEGVTGLRLNEYRGKFKYANNNALVGNGLILFYLDGFPCYGIGDYVRVWLGPDNKHSGDLRIACVHTPQEIKFAWRSAPRDADQAATTGIMTCPVTGDRDFTIDMSKCTRGPEWKMYR